MIRNIIIKRILKSTVFRVLTTINKIVPKRNDTIILYSANKGITFNLQPLFNYLIENKYNTKYKIICGIESMKYKGEQYDNVYYVTHLRAIFLFMRSAHVFYTAGQIPIKPSDNQIVIHMNHGITDLKTVGALTKINNGDEYFFSYIIASSPIYVPIVAEEYLCSEDKVKIASEPMIDRILNPCNKYNFGGFKKVLLWTPTFRQSDYIGYDDSKQEELLPLFKENTYTELNEKLRKIDCLLLVKLHPEQNLIGYKQLIYSNLRIYNHEDFIKSGYNLYDLMAQVDGMLGDYSSTCFQFLLTDKPLAFVIPDFDEYSEKRGFVFENPKDYMPGWKIYTKQEFWNFLNDFSEGKDEYIEERLRIKNIIHFYQDGNSCERILKIGNINLD